MHKQVAATGVRTAGPEGRLTQTFNDAVEVGQLYSEHGFSTIIIALDLRDAVAFRNVLQQRDDVRHVLSNLMETTAEASEGSPQSQAIAEARDLLHKWDLADYCAITRERSASRMQGLYKAAEAAGLDLNSVPKAKSHAGRLADDQQ